MPFVKRDSNFVVSLHFIQSTCTASIITAANKYPSRLSQLLRCSLTTSKNSMQPTFYQFGSLAGCFYRCDMNSLNTGTSTGGLVIMKLFIRLFAAAVLLCLPGFCVFGFLASFEVGLPSVRPFFFRIFGIGSLAIALRRVLWGR